MWNNRILLTGNLTRNIEKKMAADKTVCNFSLAVSRPTKEADADFFNCVAWGQVAEYLSSYGKKGMQISLEGRLQSRSYQKDDQTIYVTEVIVDNAHLLKSVKHGS